MSAGCIFCRIVAGDVPSARLFEDGDVVAFRDVRPQAPVHVLVVPKTHYASLDAIPGAAEPLLGRLLATARDLAGQLGLADGYRVVINTGPRGGQTVDHLHVHLLGGRDLGWPPG